MRVLFIAGYNHPVYHRKVELLADAPDVELVHVTAEGYGRPTGLYPSANGRKSYRVKTFPLHWLGRAGDSHRSYLWPPHFGLREFMPDLIQAESDLETLGTAQVSAARRLLAPQSRPIYYSWQNLMRPRSRLVRWVTRMNLRSADHVICASAEAVAVVRRQGYTRGTTVMPLVGLDTRYFFPRPAPAVRERFGPTPVIGYLGRLVPEKAVDTLVRAAARLPDGRLLIVGDGPERGPLEALARSLGLEQRCCFIGAVPYSETPDYINAMDVLVLPSRTTTHWKEQFGRVLVEAMGCAVPVVGSDSGAIPEVIGAPEQVFPEGDEAALAARLDRLLRDPQQRKEVGERGRRRALEHYAVEWLAARTLALWRELAGAAE